MTNYEIRCSNPKCGRPAEYEQRKTGRTRYGHETVSKVLIRKCTVCGAEVKPML